MPTYEYKCDKCGHGFERFQSMTDDPVKRCPKCRCKVRRVFGVGAGIIFKGSGFYETDYRSTSYKEGASKDKKEGDSKKSSPSKDDKKPAAAKKSTDSVKAEG